MQPRYNVKKLQGRLLEAVGMIWKTNIAIPTFCRILTHFQCSRTWQKAKIIDKVKDILYHNTIYIHCIVCMTWCIYQWMMYIWMDRVTNKYCGCEMLGIQIAFAIYLCIGKYVFMCMYLCIYTHTYTSLRAPRIQKAKTCSWHESRSGQLSLANSRTRGPSARHASGHYIQALDEPARAIYVRYIYITYTYIRCSQHSASINK